MLRLVAAAAAFASLGRLTQAVPDAWHMDFMGTLATEELDPIISPNAQSQHMHIIFGGNNFGAAYNYDTANASTCSTLGIQADKSNYWMPAMYYYEPEADKPFTLLKQFTRFYYQLARNSASQYVTPFPKGFRNIAGSPYNKDPVAGIALGCILDLDNTWWNGTCDGFNCARDCPGGIKAEAYFPQCWDGIHLYKSDMSHVTFPMNAALDPSSFNTRDGMCPWSHPIRLPTLLIEALFYPSEVAPGVPTDGHLIWANGDTTGYGFHADFVNGWDMDLLTAALKQGSGCTDIYSDMTFQDCPVFAPYYDINTASECLPALGELVEDGDIRYQAVEKLPGCNLPWASGTKPTCDPAVPGLDVSAFQGTDGPLVAAAEDQMAFVWPTTPGWHEIGCFYADTVFASGWTYINENLDIGSCKSTCLASGFTFAGLTLKGTDYFCQCGNAIEDAAGVWPGQCNTPCPGNASETCGGQWATDVWWAGPDPVKPNADTLYEGCVLDTSNGIRTHATYVYTSNSVSIDTCIQTCVDKNATWAMTHTDFYCYCGTDGGLYDGGFVPDNLCNMPCRGNTSELCGAADKGMLYNLTYTDVQPDNFNPHVGWQGCYQRPSSGLALTNEGWYSNGLTIDNCIDGCYQLNYTYAATAYGYQCLCGDVFHGGQLLPHAECSTQCRGNGSQTCGGPWYVDLYTTSVSTLNLDAVAAAHPQGWMGCYQDSGSTYPFADYTFTNGAMTAEICKSGCHQFGYAYAGMSGGTCACGTNGPASMQYPYYMCSSTCGGNRTETCGGSGYMDVYEVTVTPAVSTGANTTATANTTTATTSGPVYKGCFQDQGLTGLSGYMFKSTSMSVEMCTSGCHEIGYSLASVTGGSSCYCGNVWAGGAQLPESSCANVCPGNATEKCGGSSIGSLYDVTNAPLPVKSSAWVGCYADSGSTKVLSGSNYNTASNRAELCQQSCAQQGFALSGVEAGNGCYCGNALNNSPQRVPSGLCQVACFGNAGYCGGAGYIDVYNASATTQTDAQGRTDYLGCYSDFTTVFNINSYSSSGMTIEQCQRMCKLRGGTRAGVRGGNTCGCGTGIAHYNFANTTCNWSCTGNATEYCGAGYASIYDISGSQYTSDIDPETDAAGLLGCFVGQTGYPISTLALANHGRLTNELCQDTCAAKGAAFAGTFNGHDCYCGTTLNAQSYSYRLATIECSTACTGNANETCGSSNKMQIYNVATAVAARSASATAVVASSTAASSSAKSSTLALSSVSANSARASSSSASGSSSSSVSKAASSASASMSASRSTSLSASASSSSASSLAKSSSSAASLSLTPSSTSAAAAATSSAVASDEGFVGCYVGGNFMSNAGYTFRYYFIDETYCRRTCRNKGFKYAGLNTGNLCGCSNDITLDTIAAESMCSTPCAANSAQTCGGGGSYTSVFDTTGAGALPDQTYPSGYVGCYTTDGTAAIGTSSTTMTLAICESYCTARGYAYAAGTNGNGCHCQQTLPSQMLPESWCTWTCGVTGTEVCGGSNKLSIYRTNYTASISSSAIPSSSASLSASIASTVSSTSSASKSASSASATSAAASKASASVSATSTPASAPASSSSSAAPASSSGLTTGADYTSSPSYIGCFYANSTTAFTSMEMTCTSLTPQMCRNWCMFNQYTYAGLTGGDVCACASSTAGALAAPDASCGAACTGDSGMTCGGAGVTAIWNSTISAADAGTGSSKRAVVDMPTRHKSLRRRFGM